MLLNRDHVLWVFLWEGLSARRYKVRGEHGAGGGGPRGKEESLTSMSICLSPSEAISTETPPGKKEERKGFQGEPPVIPPCRLDLGGANVREEQGYHTQ